MRTFVRLDDAGKHGYGAEGDKRHDRVIALGLELQGVKHLLKMAAPKSDAQKKLEEYIRGTEQVARFPDRVEQVRSKKHNQLRGNRAA